MAGKHPLVDRVLEYREVAKLISTYIDPILSLSLLGTDGLLHPSYTVIHTRTYRLSSENPNCFSADTEILTRRGWILFQDLQEDDLVAQFDLELESIDFVKPLSFIQHEYTGDLTHIHTDEKQIDLLVTPNHECYIKNQGTKKWRKEKAINYPEWYLQYNAGYYVGGEKSYSEAQIALMCALQADGHINSAGIEWEFHKERKVKRLKWALTTCSIPFTYKEKTEKELKFGKYTYKNYKLYRFWISKNDIPNWLIDCKFLGSWLLDLDKNAFKLASNEIFFWDGSISGQSFSSNEKSNIDWGQILQILVGRRAHIRPYSYTTLTTKKHKVNWQIDVCKRAYSHTANHHKNSVYYSGYVYCVTMPKGTVIIRRNGVVSITGNCQNFPKRTHKEIRKQIVAPKGHILAAFDYAQLEGRVICMFSKDPALQKAFIEDEDIHWKWLYRIIDLYPQYMDRLAKISGEVEEKKILKAGRTIIKTDFVFASFYGSKASSLANRTQIPLKITEKVLAEFWDQYKETKKWVDGQFIMYQETGQVQSITGRYRNEVLPGNEPANSPAQGTAAEIVLEAQNALFERAMKEDLYLLPRMNGHDDLIFIPPDNELLEYYIKEISDEIVKPRFNFINVPLATECRIGYNWCDLESVTTFKGDYF
jgi:hypothetical protein